MINNHFSSFSQLRGFPRGTEFGCVRHGFYDFCGLRISSAITSRGKREKKETERIPAERINRIRALRCANTSKTPTFNRRSVHGSFHPAKERMYKFVDELVSK